MIFINKLRVFEGFAGIGAVSKALERLGIPHELIGFSEIDKYAVKSFCAVHGVSADLNYGDVCLIDETKLPDFDLYTFGSPCQDFSVAGKQKGATWICNDCDHEYNPLDVHWSKRETCSNCNSTIITKTRSSLVVEALRIIRHKKPKYLLMENVKNLVGKQFKLHFDKILTELHEYGYNTYWDVLNAKDYGVPQNRERVFVICIRKDIDTGMYNFPRKFDSDTRLKDILERQVAEKYYIAKEKTETLITELKDKNTLLLDMCQSKREGRPREYTDYAPTLSARDYKEPRLINEIAQNTNQLQFICGISAKDRIGNGKHLSRNYPQGYRIYNINGIACSLTAHGGGLGGKTGLYATVANELQQQGELDANGFETSQRVYSDIGLSLTLTNNKSTTNRIRKLTPLECWRLMGFNDTDFTNAKDSGVSDSQLYKQAGNSIVVNCIEYIFRELFISSVKSLHTIC